MLKKKDFVILLLLITVGLVLTLIIYLPKSEKGNALVVRVDGKIIATYMLQDDIMITLKPLVNPSFSHEEQSKNYNILQIKDGVSSIIEANCKDKLCVHQKSISLVGQSIVCLPHRLSITVTGFKKDIHDAISS